ncbi:MAG: alpha/beta fold hydrolase [Nodosilinea sp.]
MAIVPPVSLSHLASDLSEAGHQRLWYWRGWRIRYWFHQGAAVTTDQPPLLFIHGFGANLNQWRHNLPALSQRFPVYALDLLGFGDAEKAATLYGAELWASQVADFIEAVVGTPVVLVGHSLGALVALTVTHRHPAGVKQLVLITVPLSADREDLVAGWVSNLALKVESLVSTPVLMRPLFRIVRRPGFLRWALKGIYAATPDRVDDELLNLFVLPPGERGAARTLCYLVRSRTEPDFSPSVKTMMAALSVPTLLLWGAKDRVIPPAPAADLASLSPAVTLKILPAVGHCLYDEAWEVFNPLLITWVNCGAPEIEGG